MIDRRQRKSIASEYRERPVSSGIIAVRCSATGETWVAPSRNLSNQQNGIWFTLKHGSHPNRAVQAAWSTHGETSFSYEIVEAFDDEERTPYLLAALLKERAAAWRELLGARALTG
jgi:hypothetical protein